MLPAKHAVFCVSALKKPYIWQTYIHLETVVHTVPSVEGLGDHRLPFSGYWSLTYHTDKSDIDLAPPHIP